MADTKPWFVKNSEEIGGAFYDFYQKCGEKGVLDKKTKELLMVALACVFRCPHCTEEHLEKALEAGASKEEVTEALLIAAVEGAGTQLAWHKETFKKILG
jgi:AhpD family alkylhydroperoxidase